MSFISDIFDDVFVTLLEMVMVMLLIVDPGPVFHATRFAIASGTRKQYNSGNGSIIEPATERTLLFVNE
jgi:hypothetical protein